MYRTLLSILADLNDAVVWIVSTRAIMSKSSSSCINIFCLYWRHQLQFLSTSPLFSIFFHFFIKAQVLILVLEFTLWLAKTAKYTILQVLLFFIWLLLGLVVWPRLGDPFVFENPRGVCAFVRMVKFQLLAQFPLDHLSYPVVSCLILFWLSSWISFISQTKIIVLLE